MPGYLNANPDFAQNGGNRQALCAISKPGIQTAPARLLRHGTGAIIEIPARETIVL
jgi:hypothetical protein